MSTDEHGLIQEPDELDRQRRTLAEASGPFPALARLELATAKTALQPGEDAGPADLNPLISAVRIVDGNARIRIGIGRNIGNAATAAAG
jgi:hypothetical protein